MEPYTDEEIPYLMGQYQRRGALKKRDELVEEAKGRGLLVFDDRGEAWDLIDESMRSQIPPARQQLKLKWKLRGFAWLHWLGLGEPDDVYLAVVVSPKKLGELVFTDALVMIEERGDEGRHEVVKKLHVVKLEAPFAPGGDA